MPMYTFDKYQMSNQSLAGGGSDPGATLPQERTRVRFLGLLPSSGRCWCLGLVYDLVQLGRDLVPTFQEYSSLHWLFCPCRPPEAPACPSPGLWPTYRLDRLPRWGLGLLQLLSEFHRRDPGATGSELVPQVCV